MIKKPPTIDIQSSLAKVFIFIFILFLIYIGFYSPLKKKYLLGKQSVFVLGIYTNRVSDGDGSTFLNFNYFYKGIRHSTEQHYDCNPVSFGNRFYLQLYPQEPNICKILYKKPVPDSIIIQPFNGWDKIPAIDKTKIPVNECIEWFVDD